MPVGRAVWLAVILVGCGARTGLEVSTRDGGPGGPGGMDGGASTDAATVDAGRSDAGAACTRDRDCDDGIACTVDTCPPDLRRCQNVAADDRCDDGLFCTGVERCAPRRGGCVGGDAPCRDAVECTLDRCDEAVDACVFDPDPLRCPISHRCDPVIGCQARALAHWGGRLLEVDLPSGLVRDLAMSPYSLTDLALHPDRVLYGLDPNTLVRVDLVTGATDVVAFFDGSVQWNGLDAAPDGTLYGSAGRQVHRVDPRRGTSEVVALLPPGTLSAGDVALLEGRLLVTVQPELDLTREAPNQLVEVDLTTGRSRVLGDVGFPCVWGMAAFGPTLYGLTCDGRILEMDATTGRGRAVARAEVEFWGATAR